eukprot:11081660-Ditylum_brightwellii.AAC.1
MNYPIAFATKHHPDCMCFHQAVKHPDAPQLVDAIVKQINGHIQRGHWEVMIIQDVPRRIKVLDAVWAMKQKRNIKTRQDNQVQSQAKCA